MMRKILTAACLLPAVAWLAGCSSAPTLPVAKDVDLDRFMGDWYVIANIPTRFEVGAHNAVESYKRDQDGSIATTFTYRDGAFDGPEKVMRPRGFVRPDTIIARSALDYVWIMARTPTLSSDEFAQLERRVHELGYDLSKLEKVPQRWDSAAVDPQPQTAPR
jgi:apolipoprotein D and lipocalin family protein